MKSGNTPACPILDIKRNVQSSNDFPLQRPRFHRVLFPLVLGGNFSGRAGDRGVSRFIQPLNLREASWKKKNKKHTQLSPGESDWS